MERATNSSLILYTTEDGLTKIEATFDRDTVWLSIDQMADLFQRNKSTISRHIGNIYKEGELDKAATVAKFATVQMEGERQAPATGDIRFEHVSFAYQDKKGLQDVSIAFPRNTLTALVGPSGSGKSTVMKLCARFYDPQQGRVLFDGVPMKDIEPESLMSRISMVFQDVYLFQDTIRDNIRFGKPGATDTTRWWVRAVARCPAARNSAYPSPAPS